jgi:hypothetical protein
MTSLKKTFPVVLFAVFLSYILVTVLLAGTPITVATLENAVAYSFFIALPVIGLLKWEAARKYLPLSLLFLVLGLCHLWGVIIKVIVAPPEDILALEFSIIVYAMVTYFAVIQTLIALKY